MPAIPAGFANASLIYNVLGSARDMTFAIGLDISALTDPTPASVAALVYAAATDTGSIAAAAGMLENWSFAGVSVTIELEDGPISGQDLDKVTGTASGDGVPINSAILVTKQTAAGGRRNRGRFYMPPILPSENNVDEAGNIASGALALVQGKVDIFYAGLGTGDLAPVLFHQSAPFTPTPVTGFLVGSLLATQRRRMRS